MRETNSPLLPLSQHGARRRDAILELAGQALEGKMRGRRAKRSAIATLLLGVVALGLLLRSNNESSLAKAAIPKLAEAHRSTHEVINDEELVNELAAIGIKAGVIRIGETVRLVADDGSEIKPLSGLAFPTANQG